ncbi:hypothetical protein [Streptomyces iranensis]|uniref:Uncharacterized protein n=1 Tax=Streptomyces iranensis TaxID=576784 RepID=A0A061A762_9ACTN|nr:hypothetical protein [Streptomyces iranensis]MBP2060036.1 hypothetical protein [Streptomyces iranensis]CDR14192.1 predicted protein [Streptomyces iranensis]
MRRLSALTQEELAERSVVSALANGPGVELTTLLGIAGPEPTRT